MEEFGGEERNRSENGSKFSLFSWKSWGKREGNKSEKGSKTSFFSWKNGGKMRDKSENISKRVENIFEFPI